MPVDRARHCLPHNGHMTAIDHALIARLGGPELVGDLLGVSTRKVANWAQKGIPAQYRLDYYSMWRRAAVAILRDAQGQRFPHPKD